jgi:hypothetical protein
MNAPKQNNNQIGFGAALQQQQQQHSHNRPWSILRKTAATKALLGHKVYLRLEYFEELSTLQHTTMAAIPPPVLACPLLARAPISKFMEHYTHTSQDEYNQHNDVVMGVCVSVPGGPTPQQLCELVVNNPRESSSLGYSTLVVPAHNPAHQGMIYAMYSVTRSATCLGQPAMQWDNHIFGSINEVVGNQNPTTVKLPIDAFPNCQSGGSLF